MENLLIIFLCLFLGILFKHQNIFPSNAYLTLNTFVIYVSLPAITLLYIPQLQFDKLLLIPVCTAWIVFIAAIIFFKGLQYVLKFDHATLACLILTCGLFNSSFIGFPLIKALYGQEGMKIAILVDQPGSFLILSTLGISIAAYCATGKPNAYAVFKKAFAFPPLWGFTAAFLIKYFGINYQGAVLNTLQALAATLTPLALISIGMQLEFKSSFLTQKNLFTGLVYKLILAPALIYCLWIIVLGKQDIIVQVSIMESAMAPMITAAIIAIQFDLNKKLATAIIALGIPLSSITLYCWYNLLS